MQRILLLILIILTATFSTSAQSPFLGSTLYTPVLVTGCAGFGSGFFWTRDTLLFFVTAAHVLFKDSVLTCPTITLESHSLPSRKMDETRVVDLRAALKAGKLKRHPVHDVAVLYIASLLHGGKMLNAPFVVTIATSDSGLVPISTFMPFNEVSVSNDVYLLGYPKAIGIPDIPQLDYSQPLLRKGAVAGKNLQNSTIIIDCPSYPGNSGGPVLEIDQRGLGEYTVRVIGVLAEFIPFAEKWVNANFGYVNHAVSNSGYSVVVPMDFARDLIEIISK